ncbi:MAG: YebC/PmpR family DNA-binding transcriptional regulator [Deltaproteobacteria bacterium]|nr:YebC/PmpR family DNA-binding transcriptional regulator [Deltaproteobacteria bacterium]
MGRIFEKRKDRMFARWAKTAKAFTKVGKEISIAVKLGSVDPATNPRLRMAIQTARALNMPKDRIDAAIKRASSKDEASLQEVTYEGYAPHGIAIFVEAATNNPTRTVANVRSMITHRGGTLGTTGSLDYLFGRRGAFTIVQPPGDFDEFELEMIDHGLEDIFETESGLLLYTSFENFGTLQRALEDKKVEVKSAGLQRFPLSTIEIPVAQQQEIENLVAELEEDDDVQHVYHNMQVD